MDFKAATDRLMEEGFTAADIAEALGLAKQTIRVMRLDPTSSHHRRAPDGWAAALARMIASHGEARADRLRELAAELRKAGKGK